MVSVDRFIYEEPKLFEALVSFTIEFLKVNDPVVYVAKKEKSDDACIAWIILGTALFQGIGYSEITKVLLSIQKKFPGEKLWTLPVPKEKEIVDCVEEALAGTSWNLKEHVPGIFWSVGLFVRNHQKNGGLKFWLQNRNIEEIWRDLGEVYFMGKKKPRPKVCAAIYRLITPGIGLGYVTLPIKKWLPLPLTMGARRVLSILGPCKDGFAELEPEKKQKWINDFCTAIGKNIPETVAFNFKMKGILAAHSFQFFLENGQEGFICRKATNHCNCCPLRIFCKYAE